MATFYRHTQSLFTKESLTQLSTDLGLSLDKTQHGFEVIMPSLLMAFADKASLTTELVKQNASGKEILDRLFETKLTNFATRLEQYSDMSLGPIIHMMELLAPKLLNSLKDKKDLKEFLKDEEKSLAEVVPTDVSNYFNYGAANTEMGEVARFIEGTKRELTDYPKNESL